MYPGFFYQVMKAEYIYTTCCNYLVHYRWTEYEHSYSIYLSIIIPVVVVRYHCHQQVEQGRCQPLDLGHDTCPFDVLHVRDGHVPEQGGSRQLLAQISTLAGNLCPYEIQYLIPQGLNPSH